MSKTRILVHIVFTTKNRAKTIPMESKRRLYAYIYGVIEKKGCTTLRINGMSDHVHILVNLNPCVAVSNLVKDIKVSTSQWLKEENDFKGFNGWNEGYYAASIGSEGAKACIEYIMMQECHHGVKDFIQEVQELACEYMLEWDERDWG